MPGNSSIKKVNKTSLIPRLLFSASLFGLIGACVLPCLGASNTSHPSVVLPIPAAAPELRIKSAEQVALEKSLASLEQVYVNRLGLGLAYHPDALIKIKKLLDLSRELSTRYEKDAQKNWFASLEQKGPSKEDLCERQGKFAGEVIYIDRLSAALIERETARQREASASAALSRTAEKLELKKIEFLETQIRLGGNSHEK